MTNTTPSIHRSLSAVCGAPLTLIDGLTERDFKYLSIPMIILGIRKSAQHSFESNNTASFAMIRGGHVDVLILSALQVNQTGVIANWAVPSNKYGVVAPSIAGGMRVASVVENLRFK